MLLLLDVAEAEPELKGWLLLLLAVFRIELDAWLVLLLRVAEIESKRLLLTAELIILFVADLDGATTLAA